MLKFCDLVEFDHPSSGEIDEQLSAVGDLRVVSTCSVYLDWDCQFSLYLTIFEIPQYCGVVDGDSEFKRESNFFPCEAIVTFSSAALRELKGEG